MKQCASAAALAWPMLMQQATHAGMNIGSNEACDSQLLCRVLVKKWYWAKRQVEAGACTPGACFTASISRYHFTLLCAAGALQALLGAHCGSCQQLREQLEAAQARADAAEAAAAKTSATLTTVATLLKMVLRQLAAERKAHAQQLPQQPAAAVHVEGQ